ncbi:MAG TPA: hypothetical protein VHO25_12095 [Polyangiaceae bacterium]|nr:hypothetical protein [Polyangiaceae bacterium]
MPYARRVMIDRGVAREPYVAGHGLGLSPERSRRVEGMPCPPNRIASSAAQSAVGQCASRRPLRHMQHDANCRIAGW